MNKYIHYHLKGYGIMKWWICIYHYLQVKHKKQNSPVIDADVEATIVAGSKKWTIKLLDNGNGGEFTYIWDIFYFSFLYPSKLPFHIIHNINLSHSIQKFFIWCVNHKLQIFDFIYIKYLHHTYTHNTSKWNTQNVLLWSQSLVW
jgi:hypothetical protein